MIRISQVFLLSQNLLIDLLLEKLVLTTYFSKEKHSYQPIASVHSPCHHIDVKLRLSLPATFLYCLSIQSVSNQVPR